MKSPEKQAFDALTEHYAELVVLGLKLKNWGLDDLNDDLLDARKGVLMSLHLLIQKYPNLAEVEENGA